MVRDFSFRTVSGEQVRLVRNGEGVTLIVDPAPGSNQPVSPVSVHLDARTTALMGDALLATVEPPVLFSDTLVTPLTDKALRGLFREHTNV